MLQAVIFDMDGTLLDSEIVQYIAIHDIILEYLGYDMPPEEYMQYCGVPDVKMWPDIVRKLHAKSEPAAESSVESSTEFLADSSVKPAADSSTGFAEKSPAELERLHWQKYDRYIQENGIQPFPGVGQLFSALKEAGLKIGIGTGSLHRIVRDNLERMDIGQYVDAVAASEDCENGKPAPDVFLAAASFLQTDPADCLVVEDSANGLLAAVRAGMACVGFNGSALPSNTGSAPFVFSDYRDVQPGDFYRWYDSQRK